MAAWALRQDTRALGTASVSQRSSSSIAGQKSSSVSSGCLGSAPVTMTASGGLA